MTSARGNAEWLKDYYTKLQNESQFSQTRREDITNWSLTLLLGVVTAYAALLTSQVTIPSFWKIGLLLMTLALTTRFFIQGSIAYMFLRRWRYLENQIESYWFATTGKPTLETIVSDIMTYDHDRHATITKWEMIKAQLRAGFLPIFAVLSALVIVEVVSISASGVSIPIYGLFLCFPIYLLAWETRNFMKYDQLRTIRPEKPKASPTSVQ